MIQNDEEYQAALRRAEELIRLDPEPSTHDAHQLDQLSDDILEYERQYFPIG